MKFKYRIRQILKKLDPSRKIRYYKIREERIRFSLVEKLKKLGFEVEVYNDGKIHVYSPESNKN